MKSRIQFLLNRLGERLWVKPLAMCVVSVGGALLARAADRSDLGGLVPDVTAASVHGLLNTLSADRLQLAHRGGQAARIGAGAVLTPRVDPGGL